MRRGARAFFGVSLLALTAASAWGAGEGRGVYEDPFGRYRFSFEGEWRAGATESGPAVPDHFYLVKRGRVAAELVITSSAFPASSRLSDYAKAEAEAIEADPEMFQVSFATGLTISGQPAVRLIARIVAASEAEPKRETLAAQYWFAKAGRLWSLLVLTTPAEQERSKVVFEIERTVISSFEALEPDEVGRAMAASRKVAQLETGPAEVTLPERWTLVEIESDHMAAEFTEGRFDVFVVQDHEYGDTPGAVAHAFVENHAALESPAVGLDGECEIGGEPGYVVVFDGMKDGVAFRAQLVALVKDGNAFFLYGLCEVEAWPRARPWITAVQHTFRFVEVEAPSASSSAGEDPS